MREFTEDDDIGEVLIENMNKKVLSLLYFTATWCGPCQNLKPIMEKISDEMSDKFKFYYHDIDSAPNSPTKFGVRGVPTVMIFKDGVLMSSKVGAVPESEMKTWLEENV